MDPLTEKLKTLHGGKILDIATGYGEFLEFLANSFNNYDEALGIDLSAEIIREARLRSFGKCRFEVMDAENTGFEDNHFDTVAIRHSLHHLRHPDLVLHEMKRVLKPNGLFIICEVFQSPDVVWDNSQRHLHHWWAEVDRAFGKFHNETLTRAEIHELVSPLNFVNAEVFEYLEKLSPGRENELLGSVLRKCDNYIERMKSVGGHTELINKGKELIGRFKNRGFTPEKFLYILGRK
jgi:SAM-dependent methyltransferase